MKFFDAFLFEEKIGKVDNILASKSAGDRGTFLLSKKRHQCTLDNLNLYSIKSPQARAEEIQDFFKNELKYGITQQEFITEMVKSHNEIRKGQGLPELQNDLKMSD